MSTSSTPLSLVTSGAFAGNSPLSPVAGSASVGGALLSLVASSALVRGTLLSLIAGCLLFLVIGDALLSPIFGNGLLSPVFLTGFLVLPLSQIPSHVRLSSLPSSSTLLIHSSLPFLPTPLTCFATLFTEKRLFD